MGHIGQKGIFLPKMEYFRNFAQKETFSPKMGYFRDFHSNRRHFRSKWGIIEILALNGLFSKFSPKKGQFRPKLGLFEILAHKGAFSPKMGYFWNFCPKRVSEKESKFSAKMFLQYSDVARGVLPNSVKISVKSNEFQAARLPTLMFFPYMGGPPKFCGLLILPTTPALLHF